MGMLVLGLAACSQETTHADAVVGNSPPEMAAPSLVIQPTSTFIIPATATQIIIPKNLPSATPTPVGCQETAGRVESGELVTGSLPKPLQFRVYLPPCYDAKPQREYPTLYWLHGQTYTEDQWLRLGAAETADRLITAGVIPPLVIVMPGEQDSDTPPPENPFGEVIVRELIPFITQHYRVKIARNDRAIGGLSRGGNWALHLGLTHWELFGAIGAHSTPTFVSDGEKQIREWLSAIPDDQIPRIYLDTGADDGWRHYTLKLADILADENIPHEWYQFQGVHDESYWAAHLEGYLRWYTQEW